MSGDDFSAERLAMVAEQMRDVTDERVLAAMAKVLRHEFMPADVRHLAYADCPLPIGRGQTISQPYIVAFMTAAIDPHEGDKILEIGTGSGYQAAVLAETCECNVCSIEIVPQLGEQARELLERLGHRNVRVAVADGYNGWPGEQEFDKVIVTCAPTHVPQPLVDCLKIGGKMIIPVGDVVQELVVLEKTKKGLRRTSVLPVRFVPMTGEAMERDAQTRDDDDDDE